MIWRKKVPAQDLIGKRKVALKYWGHLGTEVFPPAELLQNFHRQHEDLTKVFFLQWISHKYFYIKGLFKMHCFRTLKEKKKHKTKTLIFSMENTISLGTFSIFKPAHNFHHSELSNYISLNTFTVTWVLFCGEENLTTRQSWRGQLI